jgi:hypothetical protein
MWQHFLALPIVARVFALAGVSLIALWGVIKSGIIKAIHATLKKATDALSDWYWGLARKKILAGLPQQPANNEKTYKGRFDNFAYSSKPYPVHLLQLTHDGVTMKVSVDTTPLLAGITPGTFVEVDTEIRPGFTREFVRRVRLLTDIPKPVR